MEQTLNFPFCIKRESLIKHPGSHLRTLNWKYGILSFPFPFLSLFPFIIIVFFWGGWIIPVLLLSYLSK